MSNATEQQSTASNLFGGRVLRYADLRREKVPFSRSHLHALIAAKKFPAPITLVEGGRASGWLESEVDAWLAERVAARDSAQRA